MKATTTKTIRNEIRKFEGKTVGDFLYSDLCNVFIDVNKINGVAIPYGEDYDVDEHAIIDYIEVYNVEGYMFANIVTVAEN